MEVAREKGINVSICRVLIESGCLKHRIGDRISLSQVEPYGACAAVDALGNLQRDNASLPLAQFLYEMEPKL